MSGPLEQELERIAKRMGWRLAWKSEPLRYWHRQVEHDLDVLDGKRSVLVQPAWVITVGGDQELNAREAREKLAGKVLSALPRRGARAA